MKKLASAGTVTLGLVLAAAVPSQAHDGDWRGVDRGFGERRDFPRWGDPRLFIVVGPSLTRGPGFVFGSYPAPVYGYTPPPPTYWSFCPRYGAYYPNVPSCPEPWVPVPTR